MAGSSRGSRARGREVRRAAAPAGAGRAGGAAPSVRAAGEELGSGEGDDEQRDVPAPLEDVVDEVEQALVGPVEVLEQEDREPGARPPLEEGTRAPAAP